MRGLDRSRRLAKRIGRHAVDDRAELAPVVRTGDALEAPASVDQLGWALVEESPHAKRDLQVVHDGRPSVQRLSLIHI